MPNKKSKSKKPTVKKAPKKFLSKKLYIAVAVLLVIFLAAYIFRGWLRDTVIPKTSSLFYANSVQKTVATENSSLQSPFNTLGFNSTSSNSSCSLEEAKGISTEIDCDVTMKAYTKLPTDKTGQANIESQAQSLQNLLSNKGWNGGSNGVTITSLVDGTYQGKDYSPDAFYEKVIGQDNCVFDTMIAYANPHPAAISTTLSCDRTTNILGTPSGEFYNSSKGYN